MKLKKYKLCAAIHTVCSMHKNQFSCLGKSLQMIEYSRLWKSHTYLYFYLLTAMSVTTPY